MTVFASLSTLLSGQPVTLPAGRSDPGTVFQTFTDGLAELLASGAPAGHPGSASSPVPR